MWSALEKVPWAAENHAPLETESIVEKEISHLKGEEENSVRFVEGMAKNKSALKTYPSSSEKYSCPLGVCTAQAM